MITLKNVTKYYNVKTHKKYILDNVSLTIPGKTNIGVLGHNGAGKSTFLKMLGGIDFPNSGTIISTSTFSWPLCLTGGFQGSLTGRENSKFVCRIFSSSQEQIKKKLKFIQLFSELGDYFDMPIKTYSSGMRARLGFAISLAFDFEYYLIDETLSVGDKNFKKKSREALLERMQTSNILLVSHDLKVTRKMCTSGIVLDKGKIHYFNEINEAIAFYNSI